jgi:hypothetical protein
MRKKPKRVVEGAIQLDWNKLDDLLNNHLIAENVDRIDAVISERRRRGYSHPKIEAAINLVRELVAKGEQSAANNELLQLLRLCGEADSALLKPHAERGLKFAGRGKSPSKLTREIEQSLRALGHALGWKHVRQDIEARCPEVLRGVSDDRFAKRVSEVRKKFPINR